MRPIKNVDVAVFRTASFVVVGRVLQNEEVEVDEVPTRLTLPLVPSLRSCRAALWRTVPLVLTADIAIWHGAQYCMVTLTPPISDICITPFNSVQCVGRDAHS